MTEATANSDATLLRRTLITVCVLGAIGAAIGVARFSLHIGFSVLLGGLLGATNLWAIARLVRGFLAESGPKVSWTLLALIKLSALFGVLIALIVSGIADLLPLAVGY